MDGEVVHGGEEGCATIYESQGNEGRNMRGELNRAMTDEGWGMGDYLHLQCPRFI